jgi:hypothetical protein
MRVNTGGSWRAAFWWAALWVGAATAVSLAYISGDVTRPLPYEIGQILGCVLFVAVMTLPLSAGATHRSWRVGIAVALLGLAVLGLAVVIGLIRFAAASGGFH